jgi:hypothetical protein
MKSISVLKNRRVRNNGRRRRQHERREIKISFLKAGEDELELLEYTNPKKKKSPDFNPWDAGVRHVSFKTTRIRDFYEQNRNSLTFLTSPVDYKTDEIDTTWTYVKDPNGTILELSEDRKPRGYWKKPL